MPSDLPAGPDSPPIDVLSSAEESLTVLRKAVHALGDADLGRQTPCTEYDVAALTGHLMGSITTLGGAAGAEFDRLDSSDSVERQVILAARPALDAWRSRGTDGTVTLGSFGEVPAEMVVRILSIEFLIHAWDYAKTTGQQVQSTEALAEYVYDLARDTITPQGRGGAGFADPVEVPDDASVLDKLIAFTGRDPDWTPTAAQTG